ncbi:MAG TPA: polyprenol monophosphomannose synthase [Anaerolineales bacterium]|nr:polyprenol monophosphomannose synthase [Anaerolineales bacterium]
MQIGMVIPTYNEANNLPRLVAALFALPLDLCLLVVDDDSPDGTGRLAEDLSTANAGRIVVIHRSPKSGLASAYIQGFRYFLKNRVNAIGQMDADFSHDPAALVAMSKRLEICDVILGSRYVEGGSIDARWSLWRRGLSTLGNSYARAILGIPYRDLTTGYRLWRSEALREMPLDWIRSKGYVFQIEMTYLAHRLKYQIGEIPIHFSERQYGRSKMSIRIQLEAVLRIWQMPLNYRNLHHLAAPNINENYLKS